MSPAAKERTGDVFRWVERLGLPTVLVVLLFWTWSSGVREDRRNAAEERKAFVASVQANTAALHALASQVAAQGGELRSIGDRIGAVASRGAP